MFQAHNLARCILVRTLVVVVHNKTSVLSRSLGTLCIHHVRYNSARSAIRTMLPLTDGMSNHQLPKPSTAMSTYNTSGTEHTERRTYEHALAALDQLTANVGAQNSSAGRQHRTDNTSRATTERFYLRSGLTWPQLDELSVIHVSGTKGKGSTCALTESILRACGVRTGFFSSPHLVEPTERFRIDGVPLTRDKFTGYFWRVYDALYAQRDHPADMPFYFQFLTVMAVHVFRGERVDCAILEVGIGGEHDCTNIVRNTATAAVTALGLEHTQMLGNTLAEIAWQKAGIAKRACRVLSDTQPSECGPVLRQRCAERGAELRWVPAWTRYRWPAGGVVPSNPMCELNGSLAVQLSYDWMRKNAQRVATPEMRRCLARLDDGECVEVFEPVAKGLEQCQWPGRFQETRLGNCRLFVDGAHTVESLRHCTEWFRRRTVDSASKKCLLFNVTGQRNAPQMLDIINETMSIHTALFAPNVARITPSNTGHTSDTSALAANAAYWRSLQSGRSDECAKVLGSVEEVLQYLEKLSKNENGNEIDVLVTGSLYMVGAVCEIIAEEGKSVV